MNGNTFDAAQDFSPGDCVLIVAIVESDFSQNALRAAEAGGATGCAIIHGRGKHIGRTESIFSMPLDIPRDLVLAAVRRDNASHVQDGIFEAVGLKTEGHGLVYQLPVTALFGPMFAREADAHPVGPPGAGVREGGR